MVTLGVTTGLSIGIGGLATALSYFEALSNDLHESLDETVKSRIQLQDQTDFLAAVILQTRRGLDLLTAKKGGLCLFLEEECCFYVN